jgi:hypothetical protein
MALPATEELVANPQCYVQVTCSEDGGFTFFADIVFDGVTVSSVNCVGMDLCYEDPVFRKELGWRTAGFDPNQVNQKAYGPLINVIADLKVLIDAGISIIAGHLQVIGRTHMLLVKPGYRAYLLSTDERLSIAPDASDVGIDAAHAEHGGGFIVDTDNETYMAATLISASHFTTSFFDCFLALPAGEEIVGAYYRMVHASQSVATQHTRLLEKELHPDRGRAPPVVVVPLLPIPPGGNHSDWQTTAASREFARLEGILRNRQLHRCR